MSPLSGPASFLFFLTSFQALGILNDANNLAASLPRIPASTAPTAGSGSTPTNTGSTAVGGLQERCLPWDRHLYLHEQHYKQYRPGTATPASWVLAQSQYHHLRGGAQGQPLVPFSEFYNDAVNNEDFNLKEDFRRWKSVSG